MNGTKLDIIDIGMIFVVYYGLCMLFTSTGKLIYKPKTQGVKQHGSEQKKETST